MKKLIILLAIMIGSVYSLSALADSAQDQVQVAAEKRLQQSWLSF